MPGIFHHLIGVLWAGWAFVWLVMAIGTKRTERREPLGWRLLYVLVGAVGATLIAARDFPWPQPMTLHLWPRSALTYWSGVALLVAGIAFSVWARLHLGRNWSGTVTVKEDHELIRTGPYAYVRHPIYTGLIAGLTGTAICAGTLRAALGVAILSTALVVKSRIEERFMRETFPAQYEKYREEVPALIPFTRPRPSASPAPP